MRETSLVRIGPRLVRVALATCALTLVLFGAAREVAAAPATVVAHPSAFTTRDLQAMIAVWASGTPAVQAVAQQTCVTEHVAPPICKQISAAVRSAWLDMLLRDPAALGRVGARPQVAARQQVLWGLMVRLDALTQGHAATLASATQRAYATITRPAFMRQAAQVFAHPIPQSATLVWATAYLQTDLPSGMGAYSSQYVALPDVYLKFANTGDSASIPAIYQPYYLPQGGTAHWTVNLSLPGSRRSISRVPITDVGPWNEDDNWWDANGTSATLPTSCPVTASLVASDATSNPLVNGICPNGHNLRRTYYYTLYQHGGLPFFQSANYQPSGTFHDSTAWPGKLPTNCAETTVAAINNDGMQCGGGLIGYNGNVGAWLRGNTADAPILNQASIDLSPAVDAALGWTYPSSGLVQVTTAGLP